MNQDEAARAQVLANWAAQLRAMDANDTDALAACFSPGASLVHLTGVVQPLPQWLAGMRRGTFVYHRLTEHQVDVQVTGDSAHLVGRIVTGQTDDGSGQAWPLQLEQDHALVDGHWLCTSSRASLW